ncbi:MAG: S8 family serine peptidase, partial [Lachnospiraceae bacterium]|nr:S8 family serine peptidase [Lachnospiraceae bacterium]
MNQKLEDSLELALGVPAEEREKTEDLSTGYDEEQGKWELIVKYSGNIERLRSETVQIETLYGGYAIVRLPQSEIAFFANQPEIEYIEQPKRLYFELYEGRYASCIPQVQNPPESLSGEGTIVAIVDSGVDYTHPDFRNEDGTTRILKLWDQGIADGVFDSGQINEALAVTNTQERLRLIPSVDVSGHGTAVLGIAAGNGRASNGENKGVATKSNLIVVKMDTPDVRGFPRTTELLRGVDFCVRQAIEYGMPISINLSFGN